MVEISVDDSFVDTRNGKSVIQKEVDFDSSVNSSSMVSISFSIQIFITISLIVLYHFLYEYLL